MDTTEILQGRCYCGAVTLTAASGAKGDTQRAAAVHRRAPPRLTRA